MLPVAFGLVSDPTELVNHVAAISDPESSTYGQYQTFEQLKRTYGAPESDLDAVSDYLKSQGVTPTIMSTGVLVKAPMTVDKASKMFGTDFELMRDPDGREYVTNPKDNASIPSEIKAKARQVVGLSVTTKQPTPQSVLDRLGSSGGEPQGGERKGCPEALDTGGFTPNQLSTAYGVDGLRSRGLDGSGARVALIEVSGYEQAATDVYAPCFGVKPLEVQLHQVTLPAPLAPGLEAPLDVEMLNSIAPGIERLDIFEADTVADPVLPYSAILEVANTGGVLVDVISTSVDFCEDFLDDDITPIMEHLFMVSAAAGITIVASSGDFGSSGCYPPDKKMSVQYPASSGYVTAVGGTTVTLNDANEIQSEVVWKAPGGSASEQSGGGYSSSKIARPRYQIGPGTGGDSRQIPDVSFAANPSPGFPVYVCETSTNCAWGSLGGTSGSTPMFAAVVTLINQELTSVGRPKLGFVNPFIYSVANGDRYDKVFRDVVEGSNALFNNSCCNASKGFDMASGWGSVDFTSVADELSK